MELRLPLVLALVAACGREGEPPAPPPAERPPRSAARRPTPPPQPDRPAAPTERTPIAAGAVLGERDLVKREHLAIVAPVVGCHRQARQQTPYLTGTIQLAIEVDATGTATRVEVTPDGPPLAWI